ncbi:AAA family ATPase [Lignipirellula cremea]|uniref:Stage V sporulation protein K n=1 Tax=Lignipirellula cremea TaxID=2528010 RepID=A0A518DRZ0_9BACT|nr:AAA family ATPase [Lignipirellula cremea]QDU94599.1 Stage V sporulation protein K [Lignipirellula cremea]
MSMREGAADAFHSVFNWLSDFVNFSDEPATVPHETLRIFRSQLRACDAAYQKAAEVCLQACPQQTGDPDRFRALMIDLHRGLLLKIFVEVSWCDRFWSLAEKELAVELFKHLWGARIQPDALIPTLQNVTAHAESLQWTQLVAPFRDYEPLRPQATEIRSVSSRFAHLIASADSDMRAVVAIQLRDVQQAIDAALGWNGSVAQPPIDDLFATSGQVSAMLEPEPPPRTGNRRTAPPAPARSQATARRGSSGKAPSATPKTASSKTGASKSASAANDTPSRKETLRQALADLNKLVGLQTIKQEIQELIRFLQVQQARRKQNLPTAEISLHCVFQGNPGAGKTTVARILGRIYYGMGLLKKGHTIETDRAGLVAEYAGQTGVKTGKKIDEALDGVLFIDEAYSLTAKGEDPYGAEAVQSLLKRMEDDRSRVVVVLAGYPEPMDRMLNSNPGLRSRFQHQLKFEDYGPQELLQIFDSMCKHHTYQLSPAARQTLKARLAQLHANRDEHFGNGRLARNLFEKAIRRLASRIINKAPLTRELLTTIEPTDIDGPAEVAGPESP